MRKVTKMDNFTNEPLTLEHLDKIQKARSHEFLIYLQYLDKKYPDWSLSSSSWLWLSSSSSWLLLKLSSPSPLLLKLSSPLSSSCSKQDKDKYTIKHNRMIKAKKAYEKAGGKY